MMMMMKKEGSLLRIIIAVTLTLLLCFLTADSEVRCIESERHALLNFKQHLEDPSNRLASWTAAAASDVDCCDWIGVVCDNRTGHVLQLHLTTFYPLYDELTDDAQWRAQYEAYERSRFGGASIAWNVPLKFVSVVLLPIVGNATMHASAIMYAVKDKLLPISVLVGWILGQPMDLNFQLFETAMLFMTVLVVAFMLQK